MSDVPYVINPEAVGDPNQTPRVRLFPAQPDPQTLDTAVGTYRRERDEAREQAANWHEEAQRQAEHRDAKLSAAAVDTYEKTRESTDGD